MLVLTRHEYERTQEAIQIGPHIRVVVVRSSDGTARIGIEAPPEVSIWRTTGGQPESIPQKNPLVADAAVDA